VFEARLICHWPIMTTNAREDLAKKGKHEDHVAVLVDTHSN